MTFAAALIGVPAAHAASGEVVDGAASADIELVRPTFSVGAMPGFERARLSDPGLWNVGFVTQYERNPLVFYQDGVEAGAVISNRAVMDLGVSVAANERIAVRFRLPVHMQWGTDAPEPAWTVDGAGAGDVQGGLRYQLYDEGPYALAAHGDLSLPTGRQRAWMGEVGPRPAAGLVGSVDRYGLTFTLDTTVNTRTIVRTTHDFVLGPEIAVAGDVCWRCGTDALAIDVGLLTRSGFDKFVFGDAEHPAEVLAGLSWAPQPGSRASFAIGHGLGRGYGTTDLRVVGGLTFEAKRRPKAEERVVVVTPPVEDVPEAEVEEIKAVYEAPVQWGEKELARVEREEIVIREPIQFELGTAKILPESIPTLHYVAGLLAAEPDILHLLVEGHASEEGSHAYNFRLSLERALAIYEELVRAGVHPDRMSVRGMGEVVPARGGAEEAALAANRRVVFAIVRQRRADETAPAWRSDVKIPWTGEAATVISAAPTAPADPAPGPTPPSPDAPQHGPQGPPEPTPAEPSSQGGTP